MQEHRFNLVEGTKVSHAVEQPSPSTTAPEPRSTASEEPGESSYHVRPHTARTQLSAQETVTDGSNRILSVPFTIPVTWAKLLPGFPGTKHFCRQISYGC